MYLSIKALHIISMVAWFAGLFYIFRLFVYHRQNTHKPELCDVFITMERRLLKAIIVPAGIMTVLTGITMVSMVPAYLSQTWFLLKMCLVLVLLGYEVLSHITHARFRDGNFFLSEKACRMINELPTLVLVGAVFFVVLKPN